MTTTIQIYGRLGRAPEQRTTAAGKAMVTDAMVVDLGRDAEAPEWFSLVAAAGARRSVEAHGVSQVVRERAGVIPFTWRSDAR